MLMCVLLILFAWFIEMPLWLSIVTTVFSGIVILSKIICFVIKVVKKAISEEQYE